MTAPIFESIAESVIESALRGLLFATAVGAGLTLLRVRNVPARKAAWTLVLIASAAMPLLMRWPLLAGLRGKLAWAVPIRMSAAVASPATQAASFAVPAQQSAPIPAAAEHPQTQTAAPAELAMTPLIEASTVPESAAPQARSAPAAAFPWPSIRQMLIGLYLAIAAALLLRLLFGLAAALRLWTAADLVSPLVAPEGHVRSSRRITSPVTVGSGIVLPADYTQWERSRLRMVLAHERSHVRQMDFWLQFLAGLYTAAFWFSPLGWFLRRKLAQLGEAMSDRAGMEAAQSSAAYAQVVLDFASLPHRRVPGVAMASSGNLSRRIDALLNEHRFRSAFAEGRRRALLSLLLIPAALFVATALIRVPLASAQAVPAPPQAAPAAAPSPAAPSPAPRTGQAFAGQRPNAAQVTAAPSPAPQAQQAIPAPPSAPPQANPPTVLNPGQMPVVVIPSIPPINIPDIKVVVPKLPASLGSLDLQLQALKAEGPWNGVTFMGPGSSFFLMPDGGAHGYAYYFSSNGDSWAIVDAKGNHLTMGSGAAKKQLDLAQRMAKGPFLWFTHDGKSYIVDDPAIVARIRALYQPMKALDRQQEDFAIQQRVFARMDEEMARSFQSSNTIRVPDLSKEMADAEAALQNLKAEQGQMLSEEKLGAMEEKLAEVEARLGTLQARAAEQNDFAAKMRDLGNRQRQLGDQQRQLGQQQKKLAQQAQQQVESIIQQCLKEGKATEVR